MTHSIKMPYTISRVSNSSFPFRSLDLKPSPILFIIRFIIIRLFYSIIHPYLPYYIPYTYDTAHSEFQRVYCISVFHLFLILYVSYLIPHLYYPYYCTYGYYQYYYYPHSLIYRIYYLLIHY